MAIASYEEFQAFMSETMAALGANPEFAPHEVFWASLTYDEFTQGNVPGIGQAVRILIPGDAARSAFVHALRGEGLFAGSPFRRMPAGGPFMTDDQIGEIAAWIDAGCPEGGPLPIA
ncbi:hypothetical protein IB279_34240 [Ensifer sp. ENS06]|uniref:hypothetical protein n=1 Tax=Ensifer sp. ENS06 TaxID=2769276 RepID=UPI0017839172|nr:hypothetical protein [Ensifer sp. ENS06]MBD9628014.1 hypothetical protein [Ensifer sp. ENS06]